MNVNAYLLLFFFLSTHFTVAQNDIGLFEAEYNSALKNFENGNTTMALFQANEIIRLNPGFLDAYYLRGRIYSDLQEHNKSLADFSYLIDKMPPLYPDIYVERGLVYSSLQKFELAINDYSNALKIDSNHLLAYIQRGYCFFEIGKFDQAIHDLDKALSIDPSNIHALYVRGSIYVYDMENDQLAIDDFTRLLEIDPTYYMAYLDRGNAYLNLNMDKNACEDFRTALINGIDEAQESIIEYCQ